MAQYLKTGKPNVIALGRECVGLRKDGTVFPLDLAVTEIQLGGEKKFIGMVRDITRLKLTEGKINEAYEIINKSPAVAFLWKNDEGWPVEYVSKNVKRLFGYTAEEFTSGKVSYTKTVHPDDLERVGAEVAGFSKRKGREEFTHEPYRIITKDDL